jgi:hypothetical protein
VVVPKPAGKPVVAVRGDDRPGMRKAEPAQAGRGGKFGDRAGGGRGDARGPGGPGRSPAPGDNRFVDPRREAGRGDFRGERPDGRDRFEDRGPRLGDTAFRAQRDAMEHAQAALKKLAAQAHGEVLTRLLTAWETRAPDQLPTAQDLGGRINASGRSAWVQALSAAPSGDAAQALLRLEMAAELPTPAEHINARRGLQLQLLTRRNDPPPAQTWAQDAAKVLASGFDGTEARRLQNALKVLLKR